MEVDDFMWLRWKDLLGEEFSPPPLPPKPESVVTEDATTDSQPVFDVKDGL